MEWNIAVAVQLADGHPQPVRRANLNHGIDGQIDELAAAQTRAGQNLDAQADKRISVCARRAEQLG
jgi:hypothetical protein